MEGNPSPSRLQWPHEYTVRGHEDSEQEQVMFEGAVMFIRENGYIAKFPETGKSSTYVDVDGRQYWTRTPG